MRAAIFSSVLCFVAACGEITMPSQASELERVDAGPGERARAASPTAMPLPIRRRVLDSVSSSSADLVSERRSDGITRVDLRGRFHSVSFIARDAAGRPQRRCADDAATVEELLGEPTR
jgi:hypothetical protein